MLPLSRRHFLSALALGSAAAPLIGPQSSLAQSRTPLRLRDGRNPFTLGVASGDPSSDGFVLWTRLAPDPLHGGGMPSAPVRVRWEVATDDALRQIVRRGSTLATPEWAHAIHVELTGLEPDRWYWYRFVAEEAASPIGRARTLPLAAGGSTQLRFAFASCQHFEHGHFTALRHLSEEELSLVFHLGDYIYEYPPGDGRVRRHAGPSAEVVTLDDYRNRYAQCKADPDLQAAHAACPWIVTWDDHEVADNYAGTSPAGGEPVEGFVQRRAAAYRAYYEHMPLRRASKPTAVPAYETRVYRGFRYGQLASFFVLDTRQYRTPQPCGDNTTWPCEAMHNPRATLLGPQQEAWLFGGFRASTARWNVIPQQVMLAKVNRRQNGRDRFTMDHWAGYEVSRKRLVECLASRPGANPVVLTGDVHSNWVNDVRATSDGPTVATELVGTSLTTGGDGQDVPRLMEAVLSDNPFVRFYNEQRGYVVCHVTPARLQADYRVVSGVTTPGAPCGTRARFVIESGRPGAERA